MRRLFAALERRVDRAIARRLRSTQLETFVQELDAWRDASGQDNFGRVGVIFPDGKIHYYTNSYVEQGKVVILAP